MTDLTHHQKLSAAFAAFDVANQQHRRGEITDEDLKKAQSEFLEFIEGDKGAS